MCVCVGGFFSINIFVLKVASVYIYIYISGLKADTARPVPDISLLIFSSLYTVTLKTNSEYCVFGETKNGLL